MKALARFGLLALTACSRFDGTCPRLTGLTPTATEADVVTDELYNQVDTPVRVVGEGFQTLPVGDGVGVPALWIESSPRVALEDVVLEDDRSLLAVVPAVDPVLAPGTYALTIENPDGCADTLDGAVRVSDLPPGHLDPSLVVSSITPPFGVTSADTLVDIAGAGFAGTPRVWLDLLPDDGAVTFAKEGELIGVGATSDALLVATVPAARPAGGPYDLVVMNPDGAYGVLPKAFTIFSSTGEVPVIESVTPTEGTTGSDLAITIVGSGFEPGVLASVVDAGGSYTSLVVGSATSTSIEATVDTSAVGPGGYLVHAENLSGLHDEWASLLVHPDGPLGTEDGWSDAGALQLARSGLGAVVVEEDGNVWMIVVGGLGASGVVGSVEVASVGSFGELGDFLPAETLSVPRSHHAVFHQDGYVYAVGGSGEDAMLASVERAPFADGAFTGTWEVVDELELPEPRARFGFATALDAAGDTLQFLAGGLGASLDPSGDVWALESSGAWFEVGTLDTPRFDFAFLPLDDGHADAIGGPHLVALEGDDGNGRTPDLEAAAIGAGGTLAFQPVGDENTVGQARIGHRAAAANGRVYLLGGTRDGSTLDADNRQADIVGSVAFADWTATADGGTFQSPRAEYALVAHGAWLYAIGGLGEDGPLASIEQVAF